MVQGEGDEVHAELEKEQKIERLHTQRVRDNQMTTTLEQDVVLGQQIQSIRRIQEAYRWMARQKLGTPKGFHITTEDYMTSPAFINVHVKFHTQREANDWIKGLNGDAPWRPCSTALRGMCARDYLDFTVFVSWEL